MLDMKVESKADAGTNNSGGKRPYTVELNKKRLVLTLVISAALAFLAGRAATDLNASRAHINPISAVITPTEEHPSLSLHEGKEPPLHRYSGVEFNVSSSNGDVVNSHLPSALSDAEMVCTLSADGKKQCVIDNTNESDEESSEDLEKEEDGHEDEHLPAGQHLLIDIKNVDGDFLNSDIRLAQAMVDVVNLSKLTLLSYHCHNLIPQGVSCVGVLLESHISFHTWPEAGVITLDLFTCGSGKLVPILPIVESLFAVPQLGSLIKPIVKWVHKLRGFRPDDYDDVLIKDLGHMLEETMDIKKEIASVQTIFQRIDIFEQGDAIDKPILPGSYEEKNSRLFQPDRVIYLDGVIQSTRDNLEAYHEALVHPAMFTHNDPKRVAIIGGGEGATLMEVLKHSSVELVQMIEIDEEMVQTSRKYIPEWSDCSDIIGSEKWCGDDKRAKIYYEDALAWFVDRFSENGKYANEEHTKFDVLIMDALDPQDDVSFAELLYTDETFISALYNSLEEDGMIIFQLGEGPDHNSAPDALNVNRRRAILMSKLEQVGFDYFHIYEDGHCGFEYPWTFLVVMKGASNESNWYKNEAEIEVAIHQRILRTHSGNPALKYFDGTTMKNYQYPHKVFEITYCRNDPTPDGCAINSARAGDVPLADLEVKASTVGDGSGRGVFTKVDIEKGSTLNKEAAANPVYISPSATTLVFKYADEIFEYIDGYGWMMNSMGSPSYYVDSSLLTFTNHGCNGSYNSASNPEKSELTEQNAFESDDDEEDSADDDISWVGYQPQKHRKLHHINSSPEYVLEDLKAGDEIFSNYLLFTEGDSWTAEVEHLKRMCSGEDLGFVTQTEITNAKGK